MTISQRYDDSRTQQPLSVMGLDYQIQNLVDLILKPQDKVNHSSDFKGYTILFHEQNQTILFHKDWNFTQELQTSWSDLEYGPSSQIDEQQLKLKNDFNSKLQKIIQYTKDNPEHNTDDIDSIEPYFFEFSKQDNNYLGLVYPVIIQELLYPKNKIQNKIVMYIGRVQTDKSGILQQSSWEKRITYLCNFLQPFLILVIIFGCIMRYAAVLVYRIEVPIKLLKKFLLQRVEHYESMKKNPMQKNIRSIECTPRLTGKSQNIQKIQDNKQIFLKQYQEKLMNNSNLPLKRKNSSTGSANHVINIQKLPSMENIKKNESLQITSDKNSENSNQIVKSGYEKNNGHFINDQMTIIPSQLLSENCSPEPLSNNIKQNNLNRYIIKLNNNKFQRKSCDSQNIQQQYFIENKYQKMLSQSFDQNNDEDEHYQNTQQQSYLKQLQNNYEQIIIQQQEQVEKVSSQQEIQIFKDLIQESFHPIQILPKQQTPRLENDVDEEFLDLNQQKVESEDNNKFSLNEKKIDQTNLLSLNTVNQKEIPENFISLQDKQQKHFSPSSLEFQSQHQFINTKINTEPEVHKDNSYNDKNKINQVDYTQINKDLQSNIFQAELQKNSNHNSKQADIDMQKLSQSEHIKGSQQKKEFKILKGVNFFRRTQSFLKQQLAQITESVNKFKESFSPRQFREQSHSYKVQLKNGSNQKIHNKKQKDLYEIDEKNIQQSQIYVQQNELDADDIIQSMNQDFDNIVHLEDIQTYSHELQVFVNTFQHLFSVISYMEEGYEKSDFNESLFRLNHAVTIFKYINNISAVGMAYFDIGNLYFGQERFEEAIELYSISLSCALQQFEVNSIQHFNQLLSSGQLPFDYIALSQFLPRLYFISLSFKELAINNHDDVQLIGKDVKSNYLLNQAVLYFKTCLSIANFLQKVKNDQYKLLEILIFTYLFLSETYIYLNQDFLSEDALNQATKIFDQLILKNKQKYLQSNAYNKVSQSPKNPRRYSQQKVYNEGQIIEETHSIKSAFFYVRGITQLKKGLLRDGCNSLTSYLENTRAYQYQEKSLFFLRNAFKKQNLNTQTIEKRIEKITPIFYDIYILIDINELLISNMPNQSIQLKILKRIKKLFIQSQDKVCIILYNQEFFILQPLMIFQNNKHWDICFENIKKSLIQHRKNTLSDEKNNYEMQNIPNQQYQTCFSPQHIEKYQTNCSLTEIQQTNYSEWEVALFKTLKEISIQEIIMPTDIKQKKRKPILLTFSFSITNPIQNLPLFKKNLDYLLETFDKKPTILNFFFPLKPTKQQESPESFNIESLQQSSFQQNLLSSKLQIKRNSKISVVNRNQINFLNQYSLSFQQSTQSPLPQHFRQKDLTIFDFNDEQVFSQKQEHLDNEKKVDIFSSNQANKIFYEIPNEKIKKFHIFQKENELFYYLQQKRVFKANFYLQQRRFFK